MLNSDVFLPSKSYQDHALILPLNGKIYGATTRAALVSLGRHDQAYVCVVYPPKPISLWELR